MQLMVIFLMVVLLVTSIIINFISFKRIKFIGTLYTRDNLLIREQNHRIKNNLQIISGLLSLQANRVQDAKMREIIEASQSRVLTIGLIHKQLYDGAAENIQIKEFIPELIHQIAASFGIVNFNAEMKIDTLQISAEKANSLGLIINELLTNSCKHAFPFTTTPWIFLKLTRLPNGQIKMVYKDRGPGMDMEKDYTETFGMALISIQIEQLNGESTWQNINGVVFTMIFSPHSRYVLKRAKKHVKGKFQ